MNFETRLLHSLQPDEATGAISVPIYQTCTFVQEAPGQHKGYDYSRTNNPTREALEQLIASLENGSRGLAFSSGLAAIDAILKLLSPGDEIVAVDDIYGGSYRLFEKIYSRFGIKVHYIDTRDVQRVHDALSPRTRLVWLESPTNPTLKISDIAAIAKIAHANGSLVVVDNTFASPALQKPLDLGADIVIHSGTKYLAGHSDVIAGLLVVNDPDLGSELKFIQNASGAILAPFESWLTIRGIQTLSLRVEKQCRNAQLIAEHLCNKSEIAKVFYPGLADHVNYHIAIRQQSLPGSVISFSLKENTEEAAARLVTATKYFKLAESLGGVKSLLCHPARMTHKSIPREKRIAAGVEDSLIRLSVGIEDASDLTGDLDQAFAVLNKSLLIIA